tara:strand:+ start:715 stop:1356 length:642 start_codon:yes stop_codon:yes gene_type:complete
MSKKKLLEESTVRKFMKFANIGHLAENYLDEAGMYEEEEEIEVAGDELPPEAGMEDEMGMEPEAELPAEEEGAMGMDEKEQMLADVVAAVADTLGVEAAVEGAEAAPEGEEAMDFAPADEEMPAAEEEEVMEMAHELEEETMMESDEVVEEAAEVVEEEEVVEGVEVMDEETVVQETVKRVTARLKAMKEAKKKEDLVESITSRIIDALKSKK